MLSRCTYTSEKTHHLVSALTSLLTLLLAAVLSNPAVFSCSACCLTTGEELRCYCGEQDDSNGTQSSLRKRECPTITSKSCNLLQALPESPSLPDPGSLISQFFRLLGNVSAQMLRCIFLDLNKAINVLRPFLSRWLGFTGLFSPESTSTSLKIKQQKNKQEQPNKSTCNWQKLSFH